jgi:hypothetical protein
VVWALAGALASGAGAESPDEPSGSWQPAFSVGFGVQNQGFETSVDSDPLLSLGGSPPACQPPCIYDGLGISGSESASVLASLFRLDAALYTPAIFAGAGVPRLFVDAGAQIPLSEGFAILRLNEEFNRFTEPMGIVDEVCPTGEEVPVGGGGNSIVGGCDHAGETDLSYDVSWYAGLGVEFTLPVSRRQFKLRPSISYFGQSLSFDANARRVDRSGRVIGGPPEGTIIREPSVSASTDALVHALGPRLTLDVEAARVGNFSLNVFLETQFYWILSDRDISFSGQSADGTADFHVKLRPLIAQGGAGLRVVWRGD